MGYDEIMKLFLERGFLMPSCEIYSDALAGFWDYGPHGNTVKNRYVDLWRRELVRRDGMNEIDGSQVMSKKVFVASGHLESFVDPIVRCEKCGATHRADRLLQEATGKLVPERLPVEQLDQMILETGLKCPSCKGPLGKARRFNLMFRLGVGAADDDSYLRPETCQSIFVDFPRLFKVMRLKLPIGIAQFGKSFRNEIAPRQGVMRLREFYQAEIEVFFNPEKANNLDKYEELRDQTINLDLDGTLLQGVKCSEAFESKHVPNKLVAYYLALLHQFYDKAGLDMKRSRFRRLGGQEKAFYAEEAFDFEVETSLGWVELVACNYRTGYDLAAHAKVSGQDISVLDGDKKVVPHVFELSMGIDRSIYCIMEHAYAQEPERSVVKLRPDLAPITVGILPLVNKDGIPEFSKKIYNPLKTRYDVFYDESGSVGRRYRRLDEIGCPACITVDYQTLQDQTVTLRDRDSMKQIRIKSDQIETTLDKILRGEDLFKQ
ncbi:MAG: glycine--tRNA ligase [Thaumarchaeota archaeon]|nr:glycine--tRNA ligase [Nitrososphaerota archaeon]